MKKSIRSVLLIAVMVALCLCIGVSASANSETIDDVYFYYNVENDEATITSAYSYNSNTSIVIPETIGGYPVTAIGSEAFSNYNNNTVSITISASVTDIAANAFNHLYNLTEINVKSKNTAYSSRDGVLFNKDKTTLIRYPLNKSGESYKIPYGVITVAESAFNDCDCIETVEIAATVEAIGVNAFRYCNSLENVTYTAPCTLKSIGDYAFYNCYNMTGITIPETVTTIGKEAFYSCATNYNISIEISKNVTYIGKMAFNSSGISAINVAPENTDYSSQDGVLFNKEKTTLIAYPKNNSASSYTVPTGV